MSTVTEIQAGAFKGTGITEVLIPSSVTSIGNEAFADCTSLTNVVLNRYGALGFTTLGENCFSGTTLINSTNFACLHTINVNGYTEEQLRNGPYQDYRDPNAPVITYTGAGFDNGAVDYALHGSCFNEDTKILCFNPETNLEEYVPIQNLKKGDLVKTYLHGYRKVDIMCKGKLRNNTKWFTTCMYKMSKTETNELIEDLIVVGGHALLVDKLNEEEYLRTCSIWGSPLIIDEKYLLLAGITDKFEIMEGNDVYTYYHFCVENDGNDETRYGIWASGALVETPCKKDIITFKNVVYI
jgi:hypothetical protein